MEPARESGYAFNGSLDAILSRVKSDNYGILEQRIKDCYSILNRDGSAFRYTRILPIAPSAPPVRRLKNPGRGFRK